MIDQKENDKKSIEKDVEYGMNYLEQMEKIQLDHHFDIRVLAAASALDAEEMRSIFPRFISHLFSMPIIKPALVSILCLVNLITLLYFSLFFSYTPMDTIKTSYVQAAGSTYSLSQNEHDLKLMTFIKDSTRSVEPAVPDGGS